MAELRRTCKDICKQFKAKKPTGQGRYGSGQARCQICDIWIDCRGAHLKDGTPATAGSIGWFCNCCNYRLRQRPRNVKYKAKLKSEEKNLIPDKTEIKVEDLHISIAQGRIIRNIYKNFSELPLDDDFERFEQDFQNTHLGFTIADNWGSLRQFYDFATSFEDPNQITLAVVFERLRRKLERDPQPDDIRQVPIVSLEDFERQFGGWGEFLHRMGYDPWKSY